jgi:hypothetical protein
MRVETRRIGRGAHQQRPDDAAVPYLVAGLAVIGFGIAGRMAGEFAPVGVLVAEHAETAALPAKGGTAFVGQDLERVSAADRDRA